MGLCGERDPQGPGAAVPVPPVQAAGGGDHSVVSQCLLGSWGDCGRVLAGALGGNSASMCSAGTRQRALGLVTPGSMHPEPPLRTSGCGYVTSMAPCMNIRTTHTGANMNLFLYPFSSGFSGVPPSPALETKGAAGTPSGCRLLGNPKFGTWEMVLLLQVAFLQLPARCSIFPCL